MISHEYSHHVSRARKPNCKAIKPVTQRNIRFRSKLQHYMKVLVQIFLTALCNVLKKYQRPQAYFEPCQTILWRFSLKIVNSNKSPPSLTFDGVLNETNCQKQILYKVYPKNTHIRKNYVCTLTENLLNNQFRSWSCFSIIEVLFASISKHES